MACAPTKHAVPWSRTWARPRGRRQRCACHARIATLLSKASMGQGRPGRGLTLCLGCVGCERRRRTTVPPARLADFAPALLGRAHPHRALRLGLWCTCRKALQARLDTDLSADACSARLYRCTGSRRRCPSPSRTCPCACPRTCAFRAVGRRRWCKPRTGSRRRAPSAFSRETSLPRSSQLTSHSHTASVTHSFRGGHARVKVPWARASRD